MGTQAPWFTPRGTILIGREYPSTKLMSYHESWFGGWGGKLNSTLVSAGGWQPFLKNRIFLDLLEILRNSIWPVGGQGGWESPNSQSVPAELQPVLGQNRPAHPELGI